MKTYCTVKLSKTKIERAKNVIKFLRQSTIVLLLAKFTTFHALLLLQARVMPLSRLEKILVQRSIFYLFKPILQSFCLLLKNLRITFIRIK